MNTRRTAARRHDEEIVDAGVPPQRNQVPPLEEFGNHDQAPVNPPPLTDRDIRVVFLQIDQAITTQAQPISTQPQETMAQANL